MADEGTTLEDGSQEPAAAPAEEAPDDTPDPQGHKLDEMGGAQVGRIEGKASGRVEWLVARMGRFGHYCLVPARDAVAANGRAWVPYTRDQIRRAPRVDPKAPLESVDEQAVLDHYGLS